MSEFATLDELAEATLRLVRAGAVGGAGAASACQHDVTLVVVGNRSICGGLRHSRRGFCVHYLQGAALRSQA